MDDVALTRALRRAQAGDERGFVELWRTLQPRLLRYLRIAIGEPAEDVAAETWFQVVRDLPRFRGDGPKFRAWLFVVARNRAVDQARQVGRRLEVSTDNADLLDSPADSDTALEAMTWLDTERALTMIARLPRDQAEAVALRVIAGLTPRQAGAVLGKRPGTVRIAVMRGLRRLGEQLEPVGGAPDETAAAEPVSRRSAPEQPVQDGTASRLGAAGIHRPARRRAPRPGHPATEQSGTGGVTR
ncbi:MAG TPA: RNA polymerase sigma factor [Actinomycetes bacterium]|nr:RNA polymerase sigma factor [Actinomycetes bacterium]